MGTHKEVGMFKSVVLATDGSEHAMRAATEAADLAAATGARLTLVTVLPKSMTLEDLEASPLVKRLPREAKAELKRIHEVMASANTERDLHPWVPALPSIANALGDVILDEAEKIATRRKATRIQRVCEQGDPADGILRAADKAKADVIVMGTRGLSEIGVLVIGSVSHKVMHHAKCSSLIVK
jgi:nucleotide-binding universal stress UspA family protein